MRTVFVDSVNLASRDKDDIKINNKTQLYEFLV